MMKIRHAKTAELDLLMEKYEHARQFMAAHGNPDQWGDNEPSREQIAQDIQEKCCYVCEEKEKIVGVFYHRQGPDSTYEIIEDGAWLSQKPYGVVHRITSDGTVKGTASFCLSWAFGQCGDVRIDTHRDNYVMQKLLEKNGFQYCGIIHLEDGRERMAYEKIS